MNKTEKIIVAALTVVLGILFIAFQSAVVKIAVVTLGLLLFTLGIIDAFHRWFTLAILKLVGGVVVVLLGIFAVRAVLYLIAGVLIIFGILLLYERLKGRYICDSSFHKLCLFLLPVICILIGILLMFNTGEETTWVFVVGGILILVEGGLLLADGILGD